MKSGIKTPDAAPQILLGWWWALWLIFLALLLLSFYLTLTAYTLDDLRNYTAVMIVS
ncbi:DUF4328 domain-containing protein [Candidatus Neomarinimicrobiota bacterium]